MQVGLISSHVHVYTIIKAELIAIFFALDLWCEQEDMMIATDSHMLCKQSAITYKRKERKEKTTLQDLETQGDHKHKGLLQAIFDKTLLCEHNKANTPP